ncbi:MAG: hypothetical protein RL189_841 [Pseudomonadota bacterium]|jgi:hypothetical protein
MKLNGLTASKLCAAFIALLLQSCSKVPLEYTPAEFQVAQAVWYEAEQTLFFFWNVGSPLGLRSESVFEVSYVNDDGQVGWMAPQSREQVHIHESVSCGAGRICGSASHKVVKEPRALSFRLRYHRDGEISAVVNPESFVIRSGAAHQNRSFVVYGVFDESNSFVQWRGRHVFPALRNEEAQALGLRRPFEIKDQTYGNALPTNPDNPYLYGAEAACPQSYIQAGVDALVRTSERAVFNQRGLPAAASAADSVCASATVNDATGSFTATAFARKNPETRAAFSSLRSPVKGTTSVGFVITPCRRTISLQHLNMQKQRLLLQSPVEICSDDFNQADFKDRMSAIFQERISQVRAAGNDMTLYIALHHDDLTKNLVLKLEQALAEILPNERARVSPRVTGAFVFDSIQHVVTNPLIKNLALWCPAALVDPKVDPFAAPDESQRSCPVLPDGPQLNAGPVRLSSLPILPSRQSYENFLGKFSEVNAGKMNSLTAFAPQRTAISTDVSLGDFAWVTFFNNERVTAGNGEFFSFCAADSKDASRIYFRTAAAAQQPLPLSNLPSVQAVAQGGSYELGLVWDFPFLLRLEYTFYLAGSANAVVASVPFGLSFNQQQSYGSSGWTQQEFQIDRALLQCTRFCLHPFFDESGTYSARQTWRDAMQTNCYRPRFPRPPEGGFPVDP